VDGADKTSTSDNSVLNDNTHESSSDADVKSKMKSIYTDMTSKSNGSHEVSVLNDNFNAEDSLIDAN